MNQRGVVSLSIQRRAQSLLETIEIAFLGLDQHGRQQLIAEIELGLPGLLLKADQQTNPSRN